MSEQHPSRRAGHNIATSTFFQYEGSSLNVRARARVMEEYAVPKVDMGAEIMRSLIMAGYRGDERTIDTGCGGGEWVISLIEKYGHSGEVDAINDSSNTFAHGQEYAKNKGFNNVRFQEMDACDLEFPDNTFEMFSAQNLWYHIDEYEEAMKELQRAAKYGAKGIISTKGDMHQSRIWQGQEIAERLVAPPAEGMPNPKSPDIFYHHFDVEEAGDIISRYFVVRPELSFIQRTILRIPPEGWPDWRQAFLSIKDSWVPIPRGGDIKRIVDGPIKDIFDREVAAKGCFTDYTHRGFFIVENTLKDSK